MKHTRFTVEQVKELPINPESNSPCKSMRISNVTLQKVWLPKQSDFIFNVKKHPYTFGRYETFGEITEAVAYANSLLRGEK